MPSKSFDALTILSKDINIWKRGLFETSDPSSVVVTDIAVFLSLLNTSSKIQYWNGFGCNREGSSAPTLEYSAIFCTISNLFCKSTMVNPFSPSISSIHLIILKKGPNFGIVHEDFTFFRVVLFKVVIVKGSRLTFRRRKLE